MTLATKNGSLIVKNGRLAENCGCCGEEWECCPDKDCQLSALTTATVTIQASDYLEHFTNSMTPPSGFNFLRVSRGVKGSSHSGTWTVPITLNNYSSVAFPNQPSGCSGGFSLYVDSFGADFQMFWPIMINIVDAGVGTYKSLSELRCPTVPNSASNIWLSSTGSVRFSADYRLCEAPKPPDFIVYGATAILSDGSFSGESPLYPFAFQEGIYGTKVPVMETGSRSFTIRISFN
jgi:hypothetical protein